MSLHTFLLVIGILCVVTVVAAIYGGSRWKSRTRAMRERLEMARLPMPRQVFDIRELEGLPSPVQRYFRAVLKDGQPMVLAVSVKHEGTFNMSNDAARWMPFTSTQRVVTQRPGFVWDARIMVFPGIPVRVHDAYVAGEGILQAAVFGLFSMVNLRDSGELAGGELIRYFAEAAWYPTALLPSQGVRWDAMDEHSTRARFSDGDITITLQFHFNENGLIDTVRAEARSRALGVSMPWQGRFWNYARRGDMMVPLEAEAAWLSPKGVQPYWRGCVIQSIYEFESRIP